MTGKCPHGFASSQGTCQTNNVHKHKKDGRRERGKSKERGAKRGRRPKPSVLVEAVGQRPRTLREERKALLFPPETRTGNGKELLALALF